jgi:hypothetical protein
MVGLFAANPRAFRLRLGRCGFSAAIPTRRAVQTQTVSDEIEKVKKLKSCKPS